MQVLQCAQRRCGHKFDAELAPVACPKCGCAWANGAAIDDDDSLWTDYTKAELIEQLEDWGVVGSWDSRSNKAELVAAVKVAEAASA